MTDPLTLSPDLLRPVQTPTIRQDRMRETAEDFEASFIAQMLRPMFEGLSTEAPFGGGQAEETWRSFLIDEMAKQTVRSGGIGLADHVMSQMLKMQEAS
ncbi:MAG: rod-binding protein [Brevundimonas sp.]|uniref:rod-binding protein n=1 Tax=Brevundimonas sp. TaxID=1871086 RepID=UPI00273490D9|nr:rod-binding protein [Brevundimonas sp.]MDP3379057.1 rod-binding protein [Brevundimonas sp.]